MEKPHFPFYWEPSLNKFKSYVEQLLSSKDKVDLSILDKLLPMLDTKAILSLPDEEDPCHVLDGILFRWLLMVCLLLFLMTAFFVFTLYFAGIMGGFDW